MFIKPLNKSLWACSSLVASLLMSACSSENSVSIVPSSTGSNLETPPQPGDNTEPGYDEVVLSGTISGVSQKGPFINGSTVKLYELDEKMHQTGVHYSTTIDNNKGKYHIDSVVITKPYAWMVANGFFLNEFTGKKSSKEITLNGLVKVEKGKDININVLSHLAFNRINYLVQQGSSIEDAQKQAEAEVLKAFDFDAEETSFKNMDIFANGEGDAKLLAVSLLLLNRKPENEYDDENDVAQAIDLMAQISYDLETDGKWDDTNLKQEIKEDLVYFTYRYDSNGDNIISKARRQMQSMTTKSIPNFEKYIKKFLSPDTIWGSCTNENEIQRNRYSDRYICQNSKWTSYNPLIEEECNAENEGKVKSVWVSSSGNPRFRYIGHTEYYRCEKGSWESRGLWVTCDTAGVAIGDTCSKDQCLAGTGCTISSYAYEGNGNWKFLGSTPALYNVTPGCQKEKTFVGDTCSVMQSEGMEYYVLNKDSTWEKCNIDPNLGACPLEANHYYSQLFNDYNGKYYYCHGGEWTEVKLVPHQYTDPRKKGLTDEEYDILDLPKDASVGDRASGLLEICYNHPDIAEYFYDSLFCMPRYYYRYRENGTWTLETEEDRSADNRFNLPECTIDQEGSVQENLPKPADAYGSIVEPGEVVKCVIEKMCNGGYQLTKDEPCPQGDKGRIFPAYRHVEYIFGRTE
jgi:hypothetical protein